MARTGLYKSEVQKARDALLAQGRHPSVDAVRIALGNTGSKTTIHKYLKELEKEDGGSRRKVSVSEALQDFVERLAAQLQEEASVQIDALRAEHAEAERRHAEELAATGSEITHIRSQLEDVETMLKQEQETHSQTRAALNKETITRHTLEQQVSDLKDRLAENESHRRSLEEKHQHARDALEHYRQSMKEQRDQDQRKHEQQIQQLQAELRLAQQTIIVKQEEVTHLNQDGARLVAELSHTRQALHEAQDNGWRLSQRLDVLHAVEQDNGVLKARILEKEVHVSTLQEQLAAALEQADRQSKQARDFELALTQAQAKYEAQQGISAELRTFLNALDRASGSGADPS